MSDYIRKADAVDAVEFGITTASAINIETGERTELFQRENDELRKAVKRIKDIEPADVVQVVHSYWEGEETDCNIKCHKCEKAFKDYIITQDYADLNEYPNFCPNCGAKMDA